MMTSSFAIGIDVGGTKIAAALVNTTTAELVAEALVPTPAMQGGAAVLHQVMQVGRDLQTAARQRGLSVRCVGIGVPELVTLTGQVVSAWNFDWRGIDLQTELDIGVPVHIESDVRCAALAEKRFGVGVELQNFSYVSIGTGVSAVQCIDGKLLRGAHGFAIHFATSDLVMLDADGQSRRFNLESYAGGGLPQRFVERGGVPGLTAADLLAGKGGALGLQLVDQSIESMASYLGQMVNMLDPQAMVIGGGLGQAKDYFARLTQRIPEFIWAEGARAMPITPSHFRNHSGVIGAACLAQGA